MLQKFFNKLEGKGLLNQADCSTKSGRDVRYSLSSKGLVYYRSGAWRRTLARDVLSIFPENIKDFIWKNFKGIFIVVATIISLIIYLINSCK